MTTKNQEQLKKVTGQTEIPFVAEGVASDISGYVISEDGATALVEASIVAERVQELESQLSEANAAATTAQEALQQATSNNETLTARVAELEAQVQALEENPAVTHTTKEKDPEKKTADAFHASAENPFNKIADSLLGAPPQKENN